MVPMRSVVALTFRHVMAFKRPGWVFETIYGTLIDVIMFGLLGTGFLLLGDTTPAVFNTLISSVALWYVVVRGAALMGTTLREELSDRNLLAVVSTGLGPVQWMCASMVIGAIVAMTVIVVAIGTVWGILGYNMLSVGWPLVGVGVALMFSAWVVGICVLCLVLFLGRKSVGWIHALSWAFIFISNVYCSLSNFESLPYFVRQLPHYVPMAYAFDGLRACMLHGAPIASALVRSCLLSGFYIVVLGAFFCWMWRRVKKRGLAQLETDW